MRYILVMLTIGFSNLAPAAPSNCPDLSGAYAFGLQIVQSGCNHFEIKYTGDEPGIEFYSKNWVSELASCFGQSRELKYVIDLPVTAQKKYKTNYCEMDILESATSTNKLVLKVRRGHVNSSNGEFLESYNAVELFKTDWKDLRLIDGKVLNLYEYVR